MIVDQGLLGAFDRIFDGLQLLGDLGAGPALLDHLDDGFEMATGALQPPGDCRM
jgi:hypothetical protein